MSTSPPPTEPKPSADEHSRQLTEQGLQQLQSDQLDAAAETLEAAIDLVPDNARAWALLGLVRSRQAEHEDALDAFETAVKLGLDTPMMRLCMARSSYAASLHSDAVMYFTRVLADGNPEHEFEARWQRGYSYKQLGEYEGALADLNWCLERRDWGLLRYFRAMIWDEIDHSDDRALRELRASVTAAEPLDDADFLHGRAHFWQRYDAAPTTPSPISAGRSSSSRPPLATWDVCRRCSGARAARTKPKPSTANLRNTKTPKPKRETSTCSTSKFSSTR